MMFASGHRPVDDVFCYRGQLDERSGLAIIDDKAVNEARRYRLAYLPDVAREQLQHYLDHLSQLVDYCRPRRHKELQAALENCLSGGFTSALPFFFYLSRDGVEGVGYKAVSEMCNRYAQSPPNINRKWLATELVGNAAPAWIVAACMGHTETAILPNGRFCRESQMKIRESVSELINPALLSAGWTAMGSKFRAQFGRDDGLPDFVDTGREFGPELRFKWREGKRQAAKAIIREAVSSLEQRGPSVFASKDKMNAARDQLFETLKVQNIPLKYAVELFSRYLAKRLRGNLQVANVVWSRSERLEPSSWKRQDLKRYRTAVACRHQFFCYLEERAKQSAGLDVSEILALRVFTLAFMSGVSSDNVYESVLSDKCPLTQVKSSFFIGCASVKNGTLRPLLIDIYSAVLSRRLQSIERQGDASPSAELKRVAKNIGLPHQTLQQIFDCLSGYVLAISHIESSGPVHAVATDLLRQSSLDLRVVTRLLYRKPLDSSFESDVDIDSGPEMHLISGECNDPMKSISSFVTALREAMSRESINAYIRDNKKSERFVEYSLSLSQERTYLSRYIKSYLGRHSLPALGQLIGHWGVWLCEHKTRHKNSIQAKTAVEYVSLIAKSLRDCAGSLVLQYDENEWEASYIGAIEGSAIGGMSSLAARLYDFHAYLVEIWSAPEIVWDDVFATAGSKNIVSKVDANIVTFDEYQSSIEFLVNHHGGSYDYKFCAWLLFLGFRFGLRWSEAYYLTDADFILGDPAGLYVNICENSHRRLKTTSSKRSIPLIGELSGLERLLVDTILVSKESSDSIGAGASGLLCVDPMRSRIIDEVRIGRIVNSVLKQASGDSRLRFHHLRHGYASRLMALAEGCVVGDGIANRLMEPLTPSDVACISKNNLQGVLTLRAISDLLGHADMATTLHSYVHVLDFGMSHALGLSIPAPSGRLIAMVLGRTEAAVRKKMQRLHIKPKSESVQKWLMGELHEEYDLVPPVLDARYFRILDSDVTPSKDVSLEVRHRILVSYAMYGRDSDLVAKRIGVSVDAVQTIIKAGIKVERTSGYERFALSSRVNNASDGEFRNETEWRNVDGVLKKINLINEFLVARAVEAWIGAYHTSSAQYYFYEFDDLIVFVRFLIALDIRVEAASFRLIGRVKRDPRALEELQTLGVIETMDSSRYHRLGKGVQARRRSIALNLKKISGSVTTKSQVNRLFFVSGTSIF
jgi:integrase